MPTAKIYADAELSPTKDDIAATYSTIESLKGTYRVVDPEGSVGVEIYVGEDRDGGSTQLGLSYREASDALDDALTPMSHSVLGERSVAYLTSDPVAVRELISVIVRGEPGADFSEGEPIFAVRGTGENASATVGGVDILEHNSVTSIGTVEIDGEEKKFQLRIQKKIVGQQQAAEGELALVREEGNLTLVRLELWS
ncbi:CG0192 family protein [Corynebacterium liangguodongii]|uniref:Uncharacterized protein n=1 Tax=Corynebacterium liangguodongii TaxID=2079535 RepID=A0A2S0WFU9_9CORY|nr:hypothetical protein [Corynebacterium liangguodongii]AWB84604.1 hypothetical protein C3E79_09060 [Corynebacterium liangguodongii]PWB99612.1 hypothetical protein DF219_04840 [Corynebacterium liangguodongii]